MKVICLGRRKGKTIQLIKECAKFENGIIVCHNKHMKEPFLEEAKKLNLKINTPITIHAFFRLLLFPNDNNVYFIDNIELCLTCLSNNRIGAITVTPTKEKTEDTENVAI